jgi:hypothetical protein
MSFHKTHFIGHLDFMLRKHFIKTIFQYLVGLNDNKISYAGKAFYSTIYTFDSTHVCKCICNV